MPSQAPAQLSDLQASVADYARAQRAHGRSFESIVAELRAGGMSRLTVDQVESWMRGAVDEDKELQQGHDPFGGELDESRRSERFEEKALAAAEIMPGASAILGTNRFTEGDEQDPDQAWHEDIVKQVLDFLVPELFADKPRYTQTRIAIPRGWRWECWDNGSKRVLASSLAMFDGDGHLARLLPRTRPTAQRTYRDRNGYSNYLPIRYAKTIVKADKRGIGQRLVTLALWLNHPGALTHVCTRVRQTIIDQRLSVGDQAQDATVEEVACPAPSRERITRRRQRAA